MTPEKITIIAAIAVFITTIATIVQIIMIDTKHHRTGKAHRANLIAWLVVTGAIFNAPFIYRAFSSLNNL